MSIQEVARTSILSKEWMYRWIKIPKLAFVERTFQVLSNTEELTELEQTYNHYSEREKMAKRCNFFYAIYQVLLMHEGPIHEFTLCMEADNSCVEIDQIVRYLLRKTSVKKLKLDFGSEYECYKLPASLFSLRQLTELFVRNGALIHKRSFNEFRCLTTLHLESTQMYDETLVRLLSNCRVLKRLTLHCGDVDIRYSGHTPIVKLFECFLLLEYLSIRLDIFSSFGRGRLPKELPTTLIHLKYLSLDRMCFVYKYGIHFLVLLIKCSPNLEKLKLEMDPDNWVDEYELGIVTIEERSDMMLEHLNKLEIRDFSNSYYELDFVKLVLAKSPVLKKLRIFTSYGCDEENELLLNKTPSSFPCASLHVVKFSVFSFGIKYKGQLL